MRAKQLINALQYLDTKYYLVENNIHCRLLSCLIFYTFGRIEHSKEVTGARSVGKVMSANPLTHLSVLVLVLVAGLAGRARTPRYK